MRFNVINMYKKLDMWKYKHHQQILYKQNIKNKYNKLLTDYKKLLVENNELKQCNNNK